MAGPTPALSDIVRSLGRPVIDALEQSLCAILKCDRSDPRLRAAVPIVMGACMHFDLNRPIPDELEGRFDVVLDPGSIVHLFDQRQAFRNLARLTKTGGRVIHGTDPSTNNVDIGFYMVSPTLYADLYPANGWKLESLLLCLYEPLWAAGLFVPPVWDAHRYVPGALDHLRFGGFDRRAAAVWAVATKLAGAGMEVLPVQGNYGRLYGEPAAVEPPSAEEGPIEAVTGDAAARPSPTALRLKRWARRLRRLLPPRLPPLHGRY